MLPKLVRTDTRGSGRLAGLAPQAALLWKLMAAESHALFESGFPTRLLKLLACATPGAGRVCTFLQRMEFHHGLPVAGSYMTLSAQESCLQKPSQIPTSAVPLASVSKESQGPSCTSVRRSSLANPTPHALELQLAFTEAAGICLVFAPGR